MTGIVLDHVNYRTPRFKETVTFYTEVLGLKNGEFPKAAPFAGGWLYDDNDIPVVHLVDVNPFNTAATKMVDDFTFARPVEALYGTGVIDHVAFKVKNYDAFVERLKKMGIRYKASDIVPGLRQLFVLDPNGVVLELNFREMAPQHASEKPK